jgi:hypothetical protein
VRLDHLLSKEPHQTQAACSGRRRVGGRGPAERVGRGSLMGGNIVDSPLALFWFCRVSWRGRVVEESGVVGTLLGPEGTGPAPHPVNAGGGVRFVCSGRGARLVAGCWLSLAVRALPATSASYARFSCLVQGLRGVWGAGGRCGCPGGRGVFVNWIVDASI